MDRRTFLQGLALGSIGIVTASKLIRAENLAAPEFDQTNCLVTSIQSFGFYQGLSPTQARSPDRTDGTSYKMPCVSKEDIDLGESRIYEFWHGHAGITHKFTVTPEDYLRLKNGESIEIYTDIVDGHRHALKIDPKETCAKP